MSAPRSRHTRQSRRDATDIWRHIALDSRRQADAQLARFDEACVLLAEHPLIGRARDDLAPDLRYLPQDNYLIFYPVRDGEPRIVRILHGHRNITPDLF